MLISCQAGASKPGNTGSLGNSRRASRVWACNQRLSLDAADSNDPATLCSF